MAGIILPADDSEWTYEQSVFLSQFLDDKQAAILMRLLDKAAADRDAMHKILFGGDYIEEYLKYEETAIVYHPRGFKGQIQYYIR
jgi:hypothetical protein